MLPEIKLDTNGFEDIAKEARSRIADIYPEWTDYNYHDPGITFLELFAFLKEAQQFHMDQIGDRHKEKFLKLLGITPKKRCSAVLKAALKEGESCVLPAGSRFWGGDMVFETKAEEYLPRCYVKALITKNEEEHQVITECEKLMVYPFGRKPKVLGEFLICLSEPLESEKNCHVSFEIYADYRIKRNPIHRDNYFYPLAEISLEYKTKKGYLTAILTGEETRGLLQSGRIGFILKEKMQKSIEEGIEGYFLKVKLQKGEYDTPPIVTGISFHQISLLQRETKASFSRKKSDKNKEYITQEYITEYYEKNSSGYRLISREETVQKKAVWYCRYYPDFYDKRILGIGDGFPQQHFSVSAEGIMSEGFQIFVESITEPGIYQMWEQTKDFDSANPMDSCYRIDEAAGEIIFGDGYRGMIPETEIRVVSCRCTKGSAGNMKAGKTVLLDSRDKNLSFEIIEDGSLGREAEQIEQCRVRAFRRLMKAGRAVTDEDYEQMVKSVPGLRIQAVKVLSIEPEKDQLEDNVVNLAIRPYVENGMGILGNGYKKNILNYLEDKRLLGTKINLYSPEYTEINILVEISSKSQYINVKDEVCRSISNYFKALEGEFGCHIRRSSLYGCVDRLEGVMKIHMLSIEARGNRVSRSQRGDVKLPPAGVLFLQKVECLIVNH